MDRSEVLRGLKGKPEAEQISLSKVLEALHRVRWIERIVITESRGVLDYDKAVDLVVYLNDEVAELLGFETVCIQVKSSDKGGKRFLNAARRKEEYFQEIKFAPLMLLVTNHQTSELIANQLLLQLAWAGSWFRKREVSVDEILAELLSLSPTPFLTKDIPLAVWEMERIWNDKVRTGKKKKENKKDQRRKGKKKR